MRNNLIQFQGKTVEKTVEFGEVDNGNWLGYLRVWSRINWKFRGLSQTPYKFRGFFIFLVLNQTNEFDFVKEWYSPSPLDQNQLQWTHLRHFLILNLLPQETVGIMILSRTSVKSPPSFRITSNGWVIHFPPHNFISINNLIRWKLIAGLFDAVLCYCCFSCWSISSCIMEYWRFSHYARLFWNHHLVVIYTSFPRGMKLNACSYVMFCDWVVVF